MAGEIRNIADFSGNPHQGRPARPGRARIYQFPARPIGSRLAAETEQASPQSPEDSPGRRGLLLGVEVAAGLFFYAMWFLWHLHH